jgi:hypothetical protein
MFIYWKLDNAGSAQTIYNYFLSAKALGHEIVLYAPEDPASRVPCSLDVESADLLVFLLEWNIYLHNNIPLDLEGPIKRSERRRRVVIDNDGMYNEVIRVDGDYNHPDVADSEQRTMLYDSISDRIYQPTLHPLRPNVGTFLFHGYNPSWEVPLDFRTKQYGMYYVGSNWFRWRPMRRLLQAIEPIREQVGGICLTGHNWDAAPWWVEQPLRDDAYSTDPPYLQKMGVEIMPPIPVEQVIPSMGKGVFNPVLVRPTFNHLRLANPRMFETLAANTIPLFGLDREHVIEIYGDRAGELVLNEDATDRIADIISRPDYYADNVQDIRRNLVKMHSFEVRIQELIKIANS